MPAASHVPHYKSHYTLKGLLGMAPHGAVTFVSELYAGSISDKELFKQSGLFGLLNEDMAVMADKGFLVCHHPLSAITPFCLNRAKCQQHRSIKGKRLPILEHNERFIGRIKLNKLFQSEILMSLMGSINCVWAVACLLTNYQCGPLVKAWAKEQ